jgi:hypothetical protein
MNEKTKITVITVIWSLGTVMLALCIPLARITQSGVTLPLTLVICIFLATITVCKTKGEE